MLGLDVLSRTWLNPQLAPILIAIILLAVVGTVFLFGVSLIAYVHRQTTRYLLITSVLGMLVARSVVGLGTVFGVIPMTIHHLLEHSFDFLIAITVLYAVYRSGPTVNIHSIRTDRD